MYLVWAQVRSGPAPLDAQGRMDPQFVAMQIDKAINSHRPVMMVVSVAGTTELGMIDPVDEVNAVLKRYREQQGLHIWHHVDAAYGGYLCSTLHGDPSGCPLSDHVTRALKALRHANSITLDPHKLGFIPYACGAFLVPDATSYSVSSINAPYLEKAKNVQFPGWSTTLGGSRAATGASAVWLSAKVMPLTSEGHGAFLNQSMRVARLVHRYLSKGPQQIRQLPIGDTNVVCFAVAEELDTVQQANERTESLLSSIKVVPSSPSRGHTSDLITTAAW